MYVLTYSTVHIQIEAKEIQYDKIELSSKSVKSINVISDTLVTWVYVEK